MWISFFKNWIRTRLSNHCIISRIYCTSEETKPPGSNCSRLVHLKTVNIYIDIWWVITGQDLWKKCENETELERGILLFHEVSSSWDQIVGVQNLSAVYQLSVLEGQGQSQRHHPLSTIWNPLHACIIPKLRGIRVDRLINVSQFYVHSRWGITYDLICT